MQDLLARGSLSGRPGTSIIRNQRLINVTRVIPSELYQRGMKLLSERSQLVHPHLHLTCQQVSKGEPSLIHTKGVPVYTYNSNRCPHGFTRVLEEQA